ncbi:MAG: hypothetical protein ACK4MF_04435 [Hyphomicrobiaceae bacterium]
MRDGQKGAAPNDAMRRLEILRKVFRLTSFVYLGLHTWVSAAVFAAAGRWAALATFVTLGLGDTFWVWTWWSGGDVPGVWYAALAASVMFATWLATKRWKDRYLIRLTIAGLDFPPDIRSGGEPIARAPKSNVGEQP